MPRSCPLKPLSACETAVGRPPPVLQSMSLFKVSFLSMGGLRKKARFAFNAVNFCLFRQIAVAEQGIRLHQCFWHIVSKHRSHCFFDASIEHICADCKLCRRCERPLEQPRASRMPLLVRTYNQKFHLKRSKSDLSQVAVLQHLKVFLRPNSATLQGSALAATSICPF